MRKTYSDPKMFELLKCLGADIVDYELGEETDYFIGLPMDGFSEFLYLDENEWALGVYTEKKNFRQWEILFFRPLTVETPFVYDEDKGRSAVAEKKASVEIDTGTGIGHILVGDNPRYEPISKLTVYKKKFATRIIVEDLEEAYSVDILDLNKMSEESIAAFEISESALRIPKNCAALSPMIIGVHFGDKSKRDE